MKLCVYVGALARKLGVGGFIKQGGGGADTGTKNSGVHWQKSHNYVLGREVCQSKNQGGWQ